MPSTWLAKPKTMPDWSASTVFLAITVRGRSSSTLRSWAPRRPSASSEMSMPGAMAPPMYSPRGLTTSKVVAVPKSTTIAGPSYRRGGGERVDDPVGADLAGVVHQHGYAGPHARLDDDVRQRAVVAHQHVAPLVQHRRARSRTRRSPAPGRRRCSRAAGP